MKGTRGDVLSQLENWYKDDQDKRVFWLNGLEGTGKSTIAQTFAEMSFADGELGASFFCSSSFEDRSTLRSIFPTIAFQLSHRHPRFRQELLPVLYANPDIGRESLCSQMEKLIVGPFQATKISTLIIVDALDQCLYEEPASALLSVLARYVDKIPLVKFFITGRLEPRIRPASRLESLRPYMDILRLHDIEPPSVQNDIKLFLKTQLANIIKNRSNCDFAGDWPSARDIDILCKKAAGFFIYASTVVKFVGSQHHQPDERLALVVSHPQDTSLEGKSGIDLLYAKILEQAYHDVDINDHEFYSRFKSVVGAVILVFHPLSIKTLSELLGNCGTPSRISSALGALNSLLLVPENAEDPVCILHRSFPNFLTNPERCKDNRFLVNPTVHHSEILLSCLDLMKRKLKKNICHLDDHAVLKEVEDLSTRTKTYIGDALEYACCSWAKHLLGLPNNNPNIKEVQGLVDEFFTTNLLSWIEVLSLIGNLDVGVHSLNIVQMWYTLVSFD